MTLARHSFYSLRAADEVGLHTSLIVMVVGWEPRMGFHFVFHYDTISRQIELDQAWRGHMGCRQWNSMLPRHRYTDEKVARDVPDV